MILNPDKKPEAKLLERVLKGGVVQIARGKDPRMHAGRIYALQTGGGKPAICSVMCLEVWEEGGGWQVKVQQQLQDQDEYLARNPDYTHERHRSIDPDVPVVPRAWLRDHLEAREGRSTLTRAQEVEARLMACRTFEERLVALRSLARTSRIDVRSEFRLIDRLRREGKLARVERLAVRVEDRVRKEAA